VTGKREWDAGPAGRQVPRPRTAKDGPAHYIYHIGLGHFGDDHNVTMY